MHHKQYFRFQWHLIWLEACLKPYICIYVSSMKGVNAGLRTLVQHRPSDGRTSPVSQRMGLAVMPVEAPGWSYSGGIGGQRFRLFFDNRKHLKNLVTGVCFTNSPLSLTPCQKFVRLENALKHF